LLQAEEHLGVQGASCADYSLPLRPTEKELESAKAAADDAARALIWPISTWDKKLRLRILFVQAEVALLSGDPEARKRLSKVEELVSDSPRLLGDRATLEFAEGRPEEALEILRPISRPEIDDQDAKNGYICSVLQRIILRQENQRRPHLLPRNPRNLGPTDWSDIAIEEDFTALLLEFPASEIANAEYGHWLVNKETPETAKRAIEYLKKAARDDHMAQVWRAEAERQLGWSEWKAGRTNDAESHFRNAKLAFSKGLTDDFANRLGLEEIAGVRLKYGEVLFQLGEFPQAYEQLSAAAAGESARKLEAYWGGIKALTCGGDWEKLEKFINSALEFKPTDIKLQQASRRLKAVNNKTGKKAFVDLYCLGN